MNNKDILKIVQESLLFKAHPWHGIETWANQSKNILNVFIEIVPADRIKYEIDKKSGYLKVDRPQQFSNIIPTLYGFIPKTYSDVESSKVACASLNREHLTGDHDPVDICILSEKSFNHGDFLLEAIPIGGLRMLDNGEVDDKIVAVLKDDAIYGDMKDIKDVPPKILESLRHYFLTYKNIPGSETKKVEIAEVYGKEMAIDVIKAGEVDYKEKFSY